MALCSQNDLIPSSNPATNVIIEYGNSELYLLATYEHLQLLYFPVGAAKQSVVAAFLLHR